MDICLAANVNEMLGEGAVICPNDSCDIDDGVRFEEYTGYKMADTTVKDWWLKELERVENMKSGDTLTVTFDLKRALMIAKKVAEGEKWSERLSEWWKSGMGYRQEPTQENTSG